MSNSKSSKAPHRTPGELRMLDIDLVDAGPQVRKTFDEEALEELAASMHAHGQATPITVRPKPDGRYLLVNGERRVRAARKVGWSTIEAVVRTLSDSQALQMMLDENSGRAELNYVERAQAYDDIMKDMGMGPQQVANHLNIPYSTLSDHLAVLRAPIEIQLRIAEGTLSATVGKYIGLLDKDLQVDAVRYLNAHPNVRLQVYKEYCDSLKERKKQRDAAQSTEFELVQQTAMFDPGADSIKENSEAQVVPGSGSGILKPRFDLPAVAPAASVSAALEQYIHDLATSPDQKHQDVAWIVDTLYREFQRLHLARGKARG